MEPSTPPSGPRAEAKAPARPKKRRLVFDVAFGIVLPIICFAADPIVFTRHGGLVLWGRNLYEYRAFAIWVLVLVILALLTWLRLRNYEGRGAGLVHGILAGALMTAGYLAVAIGVAILPTSVIGLIVVIGILGFTPLFSAVVYIRNAIAAIRLAKRKLPLELLLASLLLGAIAMVGQPAGVQWGLRLMADRAIEVVLQPDHPRHGPAIRKLRVLYALGVTDATRVGEAYEKATDPDRKKELGRLYRRISGREVEAWVFGNFD